MNAVEQRRSSSHKLMLTIYCLSIKSNFLLKEKKGSCNLGLAKGASLFDLGEYIYTQYWEMEAPLGVQQCWQFHICLIVMITTFLTIFLFPGEIQFFKLYPNILI